MKTFIFRFGFAMFIWAVGFFAGAIVFAIPALRNVGEIPWVSANPLISILAIGIWIPLIWWYSHRQIGTSRRPRRDALQIGIVVCVTNIALDYAVVSVAMGSGLGFYRFAAIWLAYLLLLVLPSWMARQHLVDTAAAA